MAGSTCTPSTIMPNQASGASSAAAIGPGSRLPSGAHGVEQVREAGEALRQRGPGLRIGRHRMAERHADAGRSKPRDEALRHLLGRERDEHHPARAEPSDARRLRVVGRRNIARIVHARPLRREKRPFEVNAEDARVDRRRPLSTASSAARIFSGVSLISVGSSDVVPNRRCAAAMARDAVWRRRVVEQHVAAAVDLHIDEAGRKPRAVRQGCGSGIAAGSSRPRQTAGDARALDHHRAVAMQARAVENGVCGHRVSVRVRSSCARDLLQVARSIDVGAEPLREVDQHGVEALDQADRVGFGLLGRQRGQPSRSRAAPCPWQTARRPCRAGRLQAGACPAPPGRSA